MLFTAFAITWKWIAFAWFRLLDIYWQKLIPTWYRSMSKCDKSFIDDLAASRYCKYESSLCATICWGFSYVPTICSPFYGIRVCWLHLEPCPNCGTGFKSASGSPSVSLALLKFQFWVGYGSCFLLLRWRDCLPDALCTVATLAKGTSSGRLSSVSSVLVWF